MASSYYKNHAAPRRPCLICGIRTRGNTRQVHLGQGVFVRLCDEHADPAFARSRSGRDCSLSLHHALQAAGKLTRRAERAIDAYVARHQQPARRPTGRARPGSYAWPEIRARLEAVLARGALTTARMAEIVRGWLGVELRRGLVRMPSLRTLRRWRHEQRWLDAPGLPAT